MAKEKQSAKRDMREKFTTAITAIVNETTKGDSKKMRRAIKSSSKILTRAVLKSLREQEKQKGKPAARKKTNGRVSEKA
jgi:hypothetical protein